MGLRLRLKQDVDVSSFSRDVQVILQAMKTYGVIVADNGSPWYISGVPDERWNNDVLAQLGAINGSDFEAVDASGLMVDSNSGQAGGSAAAPSAVDAPADVAAASTAEAPATSPTTTAVDPAPSTTAAPVSTTSTSSPTEVAARQPNVTVRARDNASKGAWPLIAAILVVMVGCAGVGYRLRRR